MANDLPEDVDVIVLGTGLTESITAAALSRIGLSVLHIDRNEYYSGTWAAFSFKAIDQWIAEQQNLEKTVKGCLDNERVSELLKDGENAIQLTVYPTVYDVEAKFNISAKPKESPPDTVKTETLKTSHIPLVSDDPSCLIDISALQDPTISDTTDRTDTAEQEDSATVPGQFDSVYVDNAELEETSGVGDKKEAVHSEIPKIIERKEKRKWFIEDLQQEWRNFNLDLAPKLLYCGGSMIKLLISSDVARYSEYRTVSRILTVRNDQLEVVPCSRADVFASKSISLPEKRQLMKFLTFAAEYEKHPEEYQTFSGKLFTEFLTSKKLSPVVQHIIQHAIAMSSNLTLTEEGLADTQMFLTSLGRYGNTAFLFPLYGTGELPQGFVRLSAVFGGTYCLTLTASHLIINNKENRCCGIITSAGQRISCKYLVSDPTYIPTEYWSVPNNRKISRAVFITDKQLLASKEEELSLLRLPQETGEPITVLDLPPSSRVCPRQSYVVQMTRSSLSEVHSDLRPAVEALFQKESASDSEDEGSAKPVVLWSLYFQQLDLSQVTSSEGKPDNVFVVKGPGSELGVDRPVLEAMDIFGKICPGEEFLARPPNPEDIIFADDDDVPADDAGRGEGESQPTEITNSLNSDSDKQIDNDLSALSMGNRNIPQSDNFSCLNSEDSKSLQSDVDARS